MELCHPHTHSPHNTRQEEVNKEPYVHPSLELVGLPEGREKRCVYSTREAIRLYILLDMESGEELGGSEETREGGGPDSTQFVCKH